ncbi:acyl carrier protein [Streptomyces sp. Vc74B-19]|uniref:acyl carrier protein n=1 Tax=unclassified Streptomyces TaxID=2593676 RepID=UPI001BFC896C|nr:MULTISPECIES: acyl carrier protein [unclassified Streptomyces]MBT3162807.1 acyl carrier protein [Streptomyces sp. Vc74B-19]
MPDSYDVLRSVLTSSFRVPEDEIEPRRTFGQLDLDSLALTELVLVLHERLGVRVSTEAASRTATLEEVARHLDALRPEGARPVGPA